MILFKNFNIIILKIIVVFKSVSDYRLGLRLDWNLTNQKKEIQSEV